MVIHSSFSDFILFIYVHMSEADHDYTPEEMAVIKSKMMTLFPAGTDFEKKLYTTIRTYNSFDKSKLNDLFEDTFHHFIKDGFAEKNKVYADLQEIISADGRIDKSETSALNALKKIIEMTAEKNIS